MPRQLKLIIDEKRRLGSPLRNSIHKSTSRHSDRRMKKRPLTSGCITENRTKLESTTFLEFFLSSGFANKKKKKQALTTLLVRMTFKMIKSRSLSLTLARYSVCAKFHS